MTLYLETLPLKPRKILLKLKGTIRAHHFILAGGTGLALQLGHRLSVDLDFFTNRPFNTEALFQKIKRLKLSPALQQEEEGTLTVMADGVKISFLHYAYPFIEKKVSEAAQNGFVTTIFNRRRYIPELKSPEAAVRSFGERTAVNTPIQGSAADIIKKAMVFIGNRIREEKKRIVMILQIHDELLFEIDENLLEPSREFIRRGMEDVVQLSVPITVDIGTGRNWSEAH